MFTDWKQRINEDKYHFLALVGWRPWKRWQHIILPRQHRRNAGTQSGPSPERPLWSPAEDQKRRRVYGGRSVSGFGGPIQIHLAGSKSLIDSRAVRYNDLRRARSGVQTVPNGRIPEERTRLRAATECWQTDSLAGGKWANNTDEPGVLIICCLHPLTLLG